MLRFNKAIYLSFLLKGCVRYLNRCATSPTYILYQLSEKNELTITYHNLPLT